MTSILLIGLGRFGSYLAKEFTGLNQEVMAVDLNEDRVNEVLPYATNAQIGDSTNEEFLKSLGVRNYDVCIVAIGADFQASLETTSLLKELGAKQVVSRAGTDIHAKFLLRNGADEVVYPEKQLALWTATRYSSERIFDYIQLDDSHSFYEVSIPESWIGKSIGEIDIRKKYAVTILALKKDGKIDMNISAATLFPSDSNLLILGSNSDIHKCFRI